MKEGLEGWVKVLDSQGGLLRAGIYDKPRMFQIRSEIRLVMEEFLSPGPLVELSISGLMESSSPLEN